MGLRDEKCFCHFCGFQVKDAIARISQQETEFKANSILKGFEYGLDLLTIEYFDTSDQIDESKDDAAIVIENYYDHDKHELNIPAGRTYSIRSKVLTAQKKAKSVYVNGDYEGIGSVRFEFSTDGGISFISLPENNLLNLDNQGKYLVMRLIITGDLIFKNISWGVVF